MRIGIFSDVHANLSALEIVLEELKNKKVDDYVCLGDVVGYGASPNECCEIVKKIASTTIVGNHDAAVSGRMDYSYYYDQARNALDWTARAIQKENLDWLAKLPYIVHKEEHNVTYCHGAPHNPETFNYIFNMDQAKEASNYLDELQQVTFIGHSHLCRVFSFEEDDILQIVPGRVELEEDKKYIISIGSVGQPRDYDPRAAYIIFDTEKRTVEQFRTHYDIEKSAKKIFDVKLPDAFGKRLFVGI